MKQAAQVDVEIEPGKYRGPCGAKDQLANRGYKTTWAATPFKDQTIDLDATVVRLTDAVAVLVAKLSMGALAQGGVWFSSNAVPNNPNPEQAKAVDARKAMDAAALEVFRQGRRIVARDSNAGTAGRRGDERGADAEAAAQFDDITRSKVIDT